MLEEQTRFAQISEELWKVYIYKKKNKHTHFTFTDERTSELRVFRDSHFTLQLAWITRACLHIVIALWYYYLLSGMNK